jgi:hypothetical protein
MLRSLKIPKNWSFLVSKPRPRLPQNRNNHTSVQAAYGVQTNNYRVEDSKHVSEGHVMDYGGCPGTSISTILPPVSSYLSNNDKDMKARLPPKKTGGQASPRALAHFEVSERDLSVAGTPLGKLTSAREQLRSLLHGPGGEKRP